jgi:environmental stress-induced protein Ves
VHVVARIAVDQVAPQRWRNGGGWTRELLTWPAGNGPWQLRISLATITAPGPFSVFAGVRRILALVSGEGLLLSIDGHPHRLTPEADPLHFAGTAAVHAEPLGGSSTDLNLMSASGRGTMLRATPGSPWTSDCAQCGLYSSGAGTLHVPGSAPLAVAPDTLTWLADAAGLPLQLAATEGETAAAAPRAWWLGYAPES